MADPDRFVEIIEQLQSQLAECYRLSGADPDGNEDWRLADRAVAEVRRLREETDAYLTEQARIIETLRDALIGLRHVGREDCWCDVAVGNPMFGGKHPPACLAARAALKNVKRT